MRTIEKLGGAFRALLKESEKNPVTITYRGVDGKDNALYELKNRRRDVIASQATEPQLAGCLLAEPK